MIAGRVRHLLDSSVRHLADMVGALAPNLLVPRTVQGARLMLPLNHRLPMYAKSFPGYGQNLVDVARLLARGSDGPIGVLDIGANVGDSALQIANAVSAKVLCVEGDPYWLRVLDRNVRARSGIYVEPALIVPAAASGEALGPTRWHGTTRFEAAEAPEAAAATTTAQALRSKYSDQFASLRIVKIDTDGYDAVLVPEVIDAWNESRPVVFFEYDPRWAARVGVEDIRGVWAHLDSAGYTAAGVWDNFGSPRFRARLDEMDEAHSRLGRALDAGEYQYWDVAVVHSSDSLGLEMLEVLFQGVVDADG